MITGFKDRRLKRFYETGERGKIQSKLLDRVEFILSLLDVAETPEDINVHSLHLHQLKGDKKGIWSVTVRANWRIIFRFENGKASDVEMTDYH
ncbi:MAG: type II toxin-antitoxin system RelE/ParE family toxin [Nitrospinae bacterium]|nr:type II toxin-antitoxin system RelE/ParE family toxin [Nitrospinota bacterium]